jgi:hypothetical protein
MKTAVIATVAFAAGAIFTFYGQFHLPREWGEPLLYSSYWLDAKLGIWDWHI